MGSGITPYVLILPCPREFCNGPVLKDHPTWLSFSGLVFTKVGFTIDNPIMAYNPFKFLTIKVLWAHGHANEIYKWYLPLAGGN